MIQVFIDNEKISFIKCGPDTDTLVNVCSLVYSPFDKTILKHLLYY